MGSYMSYTTIKSFHKYEIVYVCYSSISVFNVVITCNLVINNKMGTKKLLLQWTMNMNYW